MTIQIEESQLKTIIGQLETAKVLTPAKDRGLIQGPIDTLTRLLGTPASTPPVPAPGPAPITIQPTPPKKPWASKSGLPFLLGLSADNGNAGWDSRSAFFGFPLDLVMAFHAQGPGKNAQYRDAGALDRPDLRKMVSLALLPAAVDNQKTPAPGYTLAGAAVGAYNDQWTTYGRKLVEWKSNTIDVILRIGWEGNGDWYSWSATDGPQWAAAYQHAVRSIKRGIADAGETPKVFFDLCYNLGTSAGSSWAVPAADTWDIVSLDAYDFSHPRTSADFLAKVIAPAGKPGLQDVLALAKANMRLMGIPEFGAQFDDSTAHIEGIVDFAAKNSDWIAYINVFDGGAGSAHAFTAAQRNWTTLRDKLAALRK